MIATACDAHPVPPRRGTQVGRPEAEGTQHGKVAAPAANRRVDPMTGAGDGEGAEERGQGPRDGFE